MKVVDPDRLKVFSRLGFGSDHITRVDAAIGVFSRYALGDQYGLVKRRIVEDAVKFAPDFVLCTHIASIPPDVIESLRAIPGTRKIIGVFSDALVQFERGYFFVADYDALFFKDHYIVQRLRSKLGRDDIWYLPQACDPALHHGAELTAADHQKYDCDLTIAGNAHSFRAAEFAPLIDRNMKMWGGPIPRWLRHPINRLHQGQPVMGDDKCKAMLGAKIVLNANHYAEIDGTNKRTFEVAAIGAFQLTDTPALKDVFDPETEVAMFSTQKDMIEKIDYFLGQPEKRAAMAAKAQKRAIAEHTYAHRWAAKMEVLGLGLPPGFPVSFAELKTRAQPE